METQRVDVVVVGAGTTGLTMRTFQTLTQMDTLKLRIGPGIGADDSDPAAGLLGVQPRLADRRLLDDAAGGSRFAVLGLAQCLDDLGSDARARLDSLRARIGAGA